MPTLIDNLNLINSYKSDIKSAIENKGVDMTGVSFGSYADKIGEIPTYTPFVTETLYVTDNGNYTPGQGVDGFSQVNVNVIANLNRIDITSNGSYYPRDYQIDGFNPVYVSVPDGDGTWSRPYGLMDAISVINDNPTGTSSMYVRAFVTQINSAYSQTGTYGNAYFYVGPINSYNYNFLSAYRLLYFDGKNYNSYPSYASRPDIQIGDEVIMYGQFRIYNNQPQTIQGQTYLYALNGIYGVEPNSLFARELNQNGPYDVTYDGDIIVNVPPTVPVTESLSVSANGTYYPGQGVDGFSQVVVDVPQSVAGYTEKEITEETYAIYNLNNSASFVHRNVFEGDDNLLTVNLPNASYVGSEAFKFCSNLTRVDMDTCEVIYAQAFQACSSLLQVSMPELKSVQDNIFAGCRNLQSVDFPNLSSMSGSMFNGCWSLSQASLPEVVTLPQHTFNECSELISVYIPKCKNIEKNAFYNCLKLSDIDFTQFESIGNNAFGRCFMISQAILTNCTYLDQQNTFNNCSSLELLSLGDNYMHFLYNNILTSTKIASGLGSIYVPDYNYSWYVTANGWSSLASLIVSYATSGSPLNYSDGLVYGSTSFLDYYFSSVLGVTYTAVTGMNLPECSTIYTRPGYGDTYAIRECRNLLSITIGLSYVDSYIFGANMSKLQMVNLPNCTVIGKETFINNKSLTQVSVSLCEYVSRGGFSGCINLQSIDLPVCSFLSDYAFNNCTSLSQVSLPSLEIFSGWGCFMNCNNLESIDLPVCSYINIQCFVNCSSLSQITLRSNSVCYLADHNAFQGSPIYSKTGSIYVPASLVDEYKSAFAWNNLSSIIFPIPEP